MTTSEYEFVECERQPPMLWRNLLKLNAKPGEPAGFSSRETMELHSLIPDDSLHRYVARIVTSAAGTHAAILTTSGQTLQFHQDSPAMDGEPATKAMVAIPADIDRQGLALARAHYHSRGFDLPATQLPFAASWTDDAEKRRVRKLWQEAEHRSKPESLLGKIMRLPRGRSPGPA